MIAFLDLTALAALYAGGNGWAKVKSAIRKEMSLAIATISKVHVATLLDDLLADGTPFETVETVGQRFLAAEDSFVKVSTDAVVMEAMILAVRHHLEAEQSVQLAAALHLEHQVLRQALLDHPVIFITLDPDLAKAARAEGLRTAP